MNPNLLSITLCISTLKSDIPCITTNCNCSYQHVNLLNKYNNKFGKLNNDYYTTMLNIECIVRPSLLNAVLFINAMNKALTFVKFKDMSFVY
jgi:hypothetical protein